MTRYLSDAHTHDKSVTPSLADKVSLEEPVAAPQDPGAVPDATRQLLQKIDISCLPLDTQEAAAPPRIAKLLPSAQQETFNDCGVFTILNAMFQTAAVGLPQKIQHVHIWRKILGRLARSSMHQDQQGDYQHQYQDSRESLEAALLTPEDMSTSMDQFLIQEDPPTLSATEDWVELAREHREYAARITAYAENRLNQKMEQHQALLSTLGLADRTLAVLQELNLAEHSRIADLCTNMVTELDTLRQQITVQEGFMSCMATDVLLESMRENVSARQKTLHFWRSREACLNQMSGSVDLVRGIIQASQQKLEEIQLWLKEQLARM